MKHLNLELERLEQRIAPGGYAPGFDSDDESDAASEDSEEESGDAGEEGSESEGS